MNKQTRPKVLLVEDDEVTLIRLAAGLQSNGFDVSKAASLAEASTAMPGTELLVLDINLPDGLGLDLIDQARAKGIGILCISNDGELNDRVRALKLGADDYLVKPVATAELSLKLNNLYGRISDHQATEDASFYFDRFQCDLGARRVSVEDDLIDLTPGEFDVLVCFLKHPQIALGRERLIGMLPSSVEDSSDRAIDIMVHRLRQKFESNPKSPSLFKTVYSVGYQLDCEVTTTLGQQAG